MLVPPSVTHNNLKLVEQFTDSETWWQYKLKTKSTCGNRKLRENSATLFQVSSQAFSSSILLFWQLLHNPFPSLYFFSTVQPLRHRKSIKNVNWRWKRLMSLSNYITAWRIPQHINCNLYQTCYLVNSVGYKLTSNRMDAVGRKNSNVFPLRLNWYSFLPVCALWTPWKLYIAYDVKECS